MFSTENVLEGFPRRLRRCREEIFELSLEKMLEEVNQHLPPDLRTTSKSALLKWETTRWGDTSREPKPGPRAEFLLAMKRARPDLNLEWLLYDMGEPLVSEQKEKEYHERMAEQWGLNLEEVDEDPYVLIPSMWLREHFPRRAKDIILAFYWEIYTSDVAFYVLETGPGFDEVKRIELEPREGEEEARVADAVSWRAGERRIDEVRRTVARLLGAPFRGDDVWLSIEDLSDAEITSYVQGQLAAWRPLIRSLRSVE